MLCSVKGLRKQRLKVSLKKPRVMRSTARMRGNISGKMRRSTGVKAPEQQRNLGIDLSRGKRIHDPMCELFPTEVRLQYTSDPQI